MHRGGARRVERAVARDGGHRGAAARQLVRVEAIERAEEARRRRRTRRSADDGRRAGTRASTRDVTSPNHPLEERFERCGRPPRPRLGSRARAARERITPRSASPAARWRASGAAILAPSLHPSPADAPHRRQTTRKSSVHDASAQKFARTGRLGEAEHFSAQASGGKSRRSSGRWAATATATWRRARRFGFRGGRRRRDPLSRDAAGAEVERRLVGRVWPPRVSAWATARTTTRRATRCCGARPPGETLVRARQRRAARHAAGRAAARARAAMERGWRVQTSSCARGEEAWMTDLNELTKRVDAQDGPRFKADIGAAIENESFRPEQGGAAAAATRYGAKARFGRRFDESLPSKMSTAVKWTRRRPRRRGGGRLRPPVGKRGRARGEDIGGRGWLINVVHRATRARRMHWLEQRYTAWRASRRAAAAAERPVYRSSP